MADDGDGLDELGADDGDAGDVAVEHLAWDGETIDAADAMLDRALAYGMYVNKGRALPDVRDGLKPVQRRIITAMDEIGARAGRPYMKSAQVVGQVIGNYHPHGDVPIYDAMVRLAQGFSLNVPLVDGQGNWGSVGPKEYSDPAAAYRYTEARLTPAATDWLADLRPRGRRVPAELHREARRAVGAAGDVPEPARERLARASAGRWPARSRRTTSPRPARRRSRWPRSPTPTLDDLLAAMPGPDFPTGGIVVDPEGLAEAYERGSGTFRLQARFHVEQLPGNLQAVVVTELPFGVSPDQVVAEVVKAARAERIQDVTELPKNLSDRSGMRVQIRCKRGGDVTKLIADLMRLTSLRITVGINMTVLVDGRAAAARRCARRSTASSTFRFEVVTRRLEHERAVLLRELHRLVALLAALDAIDARRPHRPRREDDDDAREQLKRELKVRLHGARELRRSTTSRRSRSSTCRSSASRASTGCGSSEEVGRRARGSTRSAASSTPTTSCAASSSASCATSRARYGAPRRTVLGGESRSRRGAEGARRAGRSACATSPSWPRRAPTCCCSRPRPAPARRGRARRGRRARALDVGAADAVVPRRDRHRERAERVHGRRPGLPRCASPTCRSRAAISRGVAGRRPRPRRVARRALPRRSRRAGFLLLVTAGGEIKRSEAAVFADEPPRRLAGATTCRTATARRRRAARRGRRRPPALGRRQDAADRGRDACGPSRAPGPAASPACASTPATASSPPASRAATCCSSLHERGHGKAVPSATTRSRAAAPAACRAPRPTRRAARRPAPCRRRSHSTPARWRSS